ncbi:hypothetical protein [Testudinibacter sp. TR-2022]|nr:hypothetical protein [Testudinibacter sp. TR-2022]
MFKEKGYDEFLTQKILKGRESIEKYGSIPLQDVQKHWETISSPRIRGV